MCRRRSLGSQYQYEFQYPYRFPEYHPFGAGFNNSNCFAKPRCVGKLSPNLLSKYLPPDNEPLEEDSTAHPTATATAFDKFPLRDHRTRRQDFHCPMAALIIGAVAIGVSKYEKHKEKKEKKRIEANYIDVPALFSTPSPHSRREASRGRAEAGTDTAPEYSALDRDAGQSSEHLRSRSRYRLSKAHGEPQVVKPRREVSRSRSRVSLVEGEDVPGEGEVPPPSYDQVVRDANAQQEAAGVRVQERRV